jgi:hypothetical protein
MTALGDKPADLNEVAIDDLFKQAGPPEPLAPAPAKGADIESAIEAELAAGLDGATAAAESEGENLEDSLTARAQQLIDQARWEAADEYVMEGTPEAESNRASFAAAAGIEIVREPTEAAAATSPITAPEPPSAASALAAEMDEDARHHAQTVARLAAAKDREEAAKQAGAGGLDITGVSIIGEVEITADSTPRALPQSQPEAVQPAAAAVVLDSNAQEIAIPMGAAPEGELLDLQDDPEPLLLRVLEWINAPFANLSDRVRQAIGKVAIATMVNAVGVLAYVLIFRR